MFQWERERGKERKTSCNFFEVWLTLRFTLKPGLSERRESDFYFACFHPSWWFVWKQGGLTQQGVALIPELPFEWRQLESSWAEGRRLPPTIPYPVPSLAVPGTNKEKASKSALCQSAYFKKLRVCFRLLSIVRWLVGYFCTSYLMHMATHFLENKTFFFLKSGMFISEFQTWTHVGFVSWNDVMYSCFI